MMPQITNIELLERLIENQELVVKNATETMSTAPDYQIESLKNRIESANRKLDKLWENVDFIV